MNPILLTSKAKVRVRDTAPGGVSAILLAAGLSRRFGKPKQLAELEGAALVRRALSTLESSPVDEVIVVAGHRANEVIGALEGSTVKVVFNERYRTGLASSITAGLAAIDPGSGAALICLADQPLVKSALIRRIVSRYRRTGSDVVASCSGGLVSPPVLFSRRVFGELERLRGDRGAKEVIEGHPGFEKVQVAPGILFDVDTQEDLERAEELLKRDRLRRRRAQEEDGA